MTAISYPDPVHEMRDDPALSGEEASTLDLAAARASVREGVLMVFGPDGDPIPPQVVIASATERPGACLAYDSEARVPAERVAAVLEAQLRGPLAPGASEADAAAWIEGMLGLGEVLENEPDPWAASDPDDEADTAIEHLAGHTSGEGVPGDHSGSDLGVDALEHWSPEPLVLDVPEPSEVEPFDPFTFEPDDPEPEDCEVANFDLMEFELDPSAAPDEPQTAGEPPAGGHEQDPDEAATGFLPAIEECRAEGVAPADAGIESEPDAQGAASAESGRVVSEGGEVAGDPDQHQDLALPAAEDDRPPATVGQPEPEVAPVLGRLAPGGEPGVARVEEAPSQKAEGSLGLPDSLVLGHDGVLGLGCLAEAAGRVEGPVLYARIEGVPEGAILTVGRDEGDGDWGLTEADLARVSLVASRELRDFRLGVLLSTGERGDLRDGLEVRVVGPTTCEDDAGPHERAREIPLVFKPPLSPQNDLGRFALVQLAGVPASASLSTGAPDETGTWLIAPSDLADLAILLPAGGHGPVALKAVAITVCERDGTIRTIEQDLTVVPAAPSEPGSPEPPRGSGRVRGRPLDLAPALDEIGGDDDLTAVAISGLAGGARLSAGTFDDETGSWILRPGDLADLRLEACHDRLLPVHLKITAIRVDPASGAPTARATSITIERAAGPRDLPAREARPGGVGFFRPIARRREFAAAS